MLEASEITFLVGKRALISDVSVSFPPGKLHLVIGPNGAGKSTLIKVLARLLRPQHGNVQYEGADVSRVSELDLAKRRAVLSQAIEVAFPLTVREVVMMGRYPHFGGSPGPIDEQIVDAVMSFFDVVEFSDRNYQTLSGGERQRVNFARVLAQVWHLDLDLLKETASQSELAPSNPNQRPSAEAGPSVQPSPSHASCRYLFLDEPLTFLDIRHQIDFMKKVRAFADAPDTVVVGVVHDLNLAARFADHLIMLDGGRVAAAGPSSEVLTSDNIRRVFGVEPTFVRGTGSRLHLDFD